MLVKKNKTKPEKHEARSSREVQDHRSAPSSDGHSKHVGGSSQPPDHPVLPKKKTVVLVSKTKRTAVAAPAPKRPDPLDEVDPTCDSLGQQLLQDELALPDHLLDRPEPARPSAREDASKVPVKKKIIKSRPEMAKKRADEPPPAATEQEPQTPAQPDVELPAVQLTNEREAVLIQHAIDVLKGCGTGEKCSKEMLLTKLEVQLKILQSEPQPNSDKILAVRRMISKMRSELSEKQFEQLQTHRVTIEKMLRPGQRMSEEHFKQLVEIPIQRQGYEVDHQLEIFLNTKRMYEQMTKQRPVAPPKVNPFERGQSRGNRKLPAELLQKIGQNCNEYMSRRY